MNIKKFSAVFLSVAMVFIMTSCSKAETYDFSNAKTLSDVREHMEQGKMLTQDFYLAVKETNTNFESYTEFCRKDGKEARLIRYDGYQTRFIREKDKYIVVDDIKQTAALFPYENTHDDIMWSDIDFIIWAIDMALSGELSDSSGESEGSFTEVYKTENGDSLVFEFEAGKLKTLVLSDKSDKIIATYEISYDEKGGEKSLFKYKGYQITDMRNTEE